MTRSLFSVFALIAGATVVDSLLLQQPLSLSLSLQPFPPVSVVSPSIARTRTRTQTSLSLAAVTAEDRDDDDDDDITNSSCCDTDTTDTRRAAIGKLVSSAASTAVLVATTGATCTGMVLANPNPSVVANALDTAAAVAADIEIETTTTTTTIETTTIETTKRTTTNNNKNNKNNNNHLSDEEILRVVIEEDLLTNQFLVTGQLTRSIYDESCIFTDEIDTYTLDKWIKGTSRLFDASRSKVVLVPGSASVVSSANNRSSNNSNSNNNSGALLQFRFVEYLCFRIPVVSPITYLSGTLFLERSPSTGLIVSYREQWDQDVNTVVTKNSKLFTGGLTKESLDADLETFAAEMMMMMEAAEAKTN